VTRSGNPCQRWELDTPQTHKRKPDVYRELEGAENFCRNPGSEEEGPWCYVDLQNGKRWELCDVPSCGEWKGKLLLELSFVYSYTSIYMHSVHVAKCEKNIKYL